MSNLTPNVPLSAAYVAYAGRYFLCRAASEPSKNQLKFVGRYEGKIVLTAGENMDFAKSAAEMLATGGDAGDVVVPENPTWSSGQKATDPWIAVFVHKNDIWMARFGLEDPIDDATVNGGAGVWVAAPSPDRGAFEQGGSLLMPLAKAEKSRIFGTQNTVRTEAAAAEDGLGGMDGDNPWAP